MFVRVMTAVDQTSEAVPMRIAPVLEHRWNVLMKLSEDFTNPITMVPLRTTSYSTRFPALISPDWPRQT
jgi:hypothetical protein